MVFFEGRDLGIAAVGVAAADPLVLAAQNLLVALQLFSESIERCLDGGGSDGALLLRSHLTGGQAQIQRNDEAFVRGVFLHDALDVYQVRTEDLKVLT